MTRALRDRTELFTTVAHREGRRATPEELAIVHDPEYVELIQRMAQAGGGRLDVDTVASEGSWDAALAGAGCVLDAVDFAFSGEHLRSFCAVRPPGHHALRARAMGFCLFGNVGLGARYARVKHGAQRVLIVDWDVHHGNGTQALVEDDPQIHFVSMHQAPWYPGTGAAEDRGPFENVWNVPLPGGLPRERYVAELRDAVGQATRDFRPDLVLVSAGFDCLAGDPLGGFTLEPEDIAGLTRWLVELAAECCDGRLVSVLEGGYVPDRLAAAAMDHLTALSWAGQGQRGAAG